MVPDLEGHKLEPSSLLSLTVAEREEMLSFSILISIIAFLTIARLQGPQAAMLNGFNVGPDQIQLMRAQTLKLGVDPTWNFVYFTNTNSRTFPRVLYSSSGPARIQLIDVFCTGDEFLVQRTNMTNQLKEEIFGSTPTFGEASCDKFSFAPNQVMADGTVWSYYDHTYPGAGNWSLEIVVSKSPHSAGAALIRRIL